MSSVKENSAEQFEQMNKREANTSCWNNFSEQNDFELGRRALDWIEGTKINHVTGRRNKFFNTAE